MEEEKGHSLQKDQYVQRLEAHKNKVDSGSDDGFKKTEALCACVCVRVYVCQHVFVCVDKTKPLG